MTYARRSPSPMGSSYSDDFQPRTPPLPPSDARERPNTPPPRPAHAPPMVDPNNVLGVFGLSLRTREEDLEEEFARYGKVEKIVIVYDQRTDRSRGFGFITMRTTEEAARCIENINGLNLHGRNIRVDYSATRKPHDPTPGEYMGAKKPIFEDRYDRRGGRYDDYRGGYDRRPYDDRDRRGYERERPRYGDRDRYRGREGHGGPRRGDDDRFYRHDAYHDRRRSPSPRRNRYSVSPGRRVPRDYDAPSPPGSMPSRY
ncbi:hypothetical protein IAT38_002945 [Cryptococcus sp. DSM 104549]